MTIVVGYTPRPEGLAALTTAIEEASLRSERLIVVNTGSNGDFSDASFATAQDLDAIDLQLSEKGVEHEIRQPTRGLPAAEELLDVVDEVGASLLVIGLRRRSPVGKLITGSTAQHVLLDASCNVLAVKAPGPTA
ncbi:MAG: universal stress protein [Ornithinibacter sp.]